MTPPELYPISFTALVDRMARELTEAKEVYGLPKREWWIPNPTIDLSFDHLGHRLANASGPASGPHTQLAANLLLAWLAGGRFMELKTVQINDALELPRPCIDVPHIGYNVEWSQELRVPQSALEYVKGWMLIHMMASKSGPQHWERVGCRFDLSVGYDLKGVRSKKVSDYIRVMRDASQLIQQLKEELPPRLKKWADVQIPSTICDSITLSTFHGCPADEVEAIAAQCLDWGLHTVVKLNPTLLGYPSVRDTLDHMGYNGIQLDPADFNADLKWDDMIAMVKRLDQKAKALKLGFGVKFSNTLVCKSEEPNFDSSQPMYLSGAPLHVLALTLADRFRQAIGPDMPITFSAGVDATNYADLVHAGLGPITSCTDLLKGRGYGRLSKYLKNHEAALLAGSQPPKDRAARAEHLKTLAATVRDDPRYQRTKNNTPPKKKGTALALLDCITCDKCIPVCPNAANFSLDVPPGTYEGGVVHFNEDGFHIEPAQPLIVTKRHQIGNAADLCNRCGQCDIWCPEDGGPYLVKPSIFRSEVSLSDHPDRLAFALNEDKSRLTWRRRPDQLIQLTRFSDGREQITLGESSLSFVEQTLVKTSGTGSFDLNLYTTLRLFLDSVRRPGPHWMG